MSKRELKTITQSPDFSIYELPDSKIKSYTISTPETIELTDPFVVGIDYRNTLGSAITKCLSHPEIKQYIENESDESLNVLHFLRGGLNFEVLDSLGKVGKKNARASFMSSERTLQNGVWKIRDDQYVKLTLKDDSTILIGDLVATGVTMKAGLQKLLEEIKKQKTRIKRTIVFVVGGEKTEEILTEFEKEAKENSPDYQGTIAVYIEGAFHVPNEETPARIKIEGTDLIPLNATLAPEFEQALIKEPLRAIERCIVYDGGSRGFHPAHHFEDILEYTNQLKEEIKKGTTLYDLILDRWEGIEKLPEETKQKLSSKEFAETWIKQRLDKLNNLLA